MIKLKHLSSNSNEFVLNSELIEQIDQVPDTLITLTTGKKVIVAESPDEVIEKIIDFRSKIMVKYKKCIELEIE